MALASGLTEALRGHYILARELGRGGMATVYLARDLKHDRQVALKVLRQELAAVIGADRFLAEIKTTAHLQHPHILPLFDSGAADSFLYYVMPYVDGESLRDRLGREKQLPLGDAVRIAREVASALDYAHRHGVIHRDIKPENILLHDGQALVADFGIALAVSRAGDTRMTESGMSLGTPHYMSPEQAMGERAITARSDVYALGAVLYEMLIGEPPFTGPTAQAIVARVLTEAPRALRPQRHTIPPHVEAATLRALEKLPADRFSGPAQFAEALTDDRVTTRQPAVSSARLIRGRTAKWIAVAAGGVLAAIVLGLLLRRPATDPPSRHFQIVLPDSAPLDFFAPSHYGEGRPALAITPDGSSLVYVARRSDQQTQLYLRRLDRPEFTAIPGTEGAADPFVSPDGAWIGFTAGGQLRKVALAGGPVSVIASVPESQGMAWLGDGRIVDHRPWAVPASGGVWKPPAPGVREYPGFNQSYPARLPGDRWVILSRDRELTLVSLSDSVQIPLRYGNKRGSQSEAIVGASPHYVSSGHVLFVANGTLAAFPFDADRLRVLGPAEALIPGVRQEALEAAQMAIAEDGTLIYAAGKNAAQSLLVWADSTGRVRDTLPLPRAEYFDIAVSPNGRHIITQSRTPTGGVQWLLVDVAQGLVRSFNVDNPSTSRIAYWWPNSERVVVYSNGMTIAYPLSHLQRPDTLLQRSRPVTAVSPKLDYMAVYYSLGAPTVPDSAGGWLVPFNGGAWSRLDPFSYGLMSFSPDGRWIAIEGREGLYVSAVPASGPATQVSPGGGDEPKWSPRGDALYYRTGNRWMMVTISIRRGRLTAGKPRLLFQARYLQVLNKSYDIGPDGRFLMLAGPQEETTRQLEVVTGFFGELRRRLGTPP